MIGVKPSITGLVLGPKSKAYRPSKAACRSESSRSRRTLSMNSGAGGLSPMPNTSVVMPPRFSIRPGRDFSPTYNCFTGMISVLCARRDDRRVVHPGPVVPGRRVANLDVKRQRVLGVGVEVGLEEIVAGPVLRPIHAHVRLVDPQRLAALGGMLCHHGAALEGILVLERGDQLDRMPAATAFLISSGVPQA